MAYQNVDKVVAVIRGVPRTYTIAKKSTDKLYYIFDENGGRNIEHAFTTLERAKAYVPTMDHMTRFSATVRKMV